LENTQDNSLWSEINFHKGLV